MFWKDPEILKTGSNRQEPRNPSLEGGGGPLPEEPDHGQHCPRPPSPTKKQWDSLAFSHE